MLVHRASSTTVYRPQFGHVKRNWEGSMLPLRVEEAPPSRIRQVFTNIIGVLRNFFAPSRQQQPVVDSASVNTLVVPARPHSPGGKTE